MQIDLQFSGRDILLPMASQYPLQSLIYHLLSGAPDYAAFLHDTGFRSGVRTYRLFTFGPPDGRYEQREDGLLYPAGFRLEVRSCDPMFIQAMLQSTAKLRACRLCGNPLRLSAVRLFDEHISAEAVRIRMISPVTVHTTLPDGTTRYFSPEEEGFCAAVAENAAEKWRAYYRREPPGALAIAPLGDRYPKTVTTYKGNYITGYSGAFRLAGAPRLLDFLYNTGLGGKNAQGFGMFQLLSP